MTGAEAAFTAFGLASQAFLLGFFAARRWRPRVAARIGWTVYALAGLGLPLGLLLLVDRQPWTLVIGPVLMALWALFGSYIDVWRPRPWRRPPIAWHLLIPFVALFFSAQMFLWWPLWNIERVAWVIFLVLFVPNTVLNIRGHFDGGFERVA
jgi:hypothetical protein